jgi:hypothetical protein
MYLFFKDASIFEHLTPTQTARRLYYRRSPFKIPTVDSLLSSSFKRGLRIILDSIIQRQPAYKTHHRQPAPTTFTSVYGVPEFHSPSITHTFIPEKKECAVFHTLYDLTITITCSFSVTLGNRRITTVR